MAAMKRFSVTAPQFMVDYLERVRDYLEHKKGVRPKRAEVIRELITRSLAAWDEPWNEPDEWGDPKQTRLELE